MPFGPDCQYADMEACERANADRQDPAAYCAAIMRRTEGHCMSSQLDLGFDPASVLAAVGVDDLSKLHPVGDMGDVFERLRAGDGADVPPRARFRRPQSREPRPWYQISAKAADDDAPGGDDKAKPTKADADTTIIDIYDEIGWYGTGAKDFVRDLRGIKTKRIEVHLNSPGGDVFDALAIYNGLRQHKAQVHVIVDSLAASSASFIAMAGDKVTAMANAMLMIHDPWGLVVGNAADMRELADLLDKHGDNIAAIYANKAGGAISDWRERMLDETWYLADEAYEAGLVDIVDDADGRSVSDSWDLSVFAHPPAPSQATTAAPPEPLPPPAAAATPEPAAAPAPASSPTRTVTGGNSRRPLGAPASWYLPPSPEGGTSAWPMP